MTKSKFNSPPRRIKSPKRRIKFVGSGKTAQDVQDAIFRKMSASKKLRLASDFSLFCLDLNKLGKQDDISSVDHKNRQDS